MSFIWNKNNNFKFKITDRFNLIFIFKIIYEK